MEYVDLAVVGAGAAGMSAALYAKRKNLTVRIFDKGQGGGTVTWAVLVENYPGKPPQKGTDLMADFEKQLRSEGVEIEKGKEVKGISKEGGGFVLDLEGEKAGARAVVIATGSVHRKLGIKGEEEFSGRGVSYCAVCDGPFFKGKDVAVIGAGNSGVSASLYMKETCPKVYLIESRDRPLCEGVYLDRLGKSDVEARYGTEVREILGEGKVTGIKVRDRGSGEEKEIKVNGVFVYIGLSPQIRLAEKLGAKIDENGFIAIGRGSETAVPGIFAAGDVTGGLQQIVMAAAEGAAAAVSAHNYIKSGSG